MPLAQQIDGPVAVIGDVHGQVAELDAIVEQLRSLPDYQERWIVFIGDLVDRGPDPAGAVERVLRLCQEHPKTTGVAGNHELAMMLACELAPEADSESWAERWTNHYGAESTFRSYGVQYPNCEALREALPASHVRLLQDLPWAVDHPQFFFVHAGLDPVMNFETQRRILAARDFSLNRPSWLCSKSFANERVPTDCDRVVVSGHVPFDQVQSFPQRLLIDTTGGLGGSLSCVLLPERALISSGPPPEMPQPRRHAEYPDAEPTRKWFEFWK